jgi:hypothetical protein
VTRVTGMGLVLTLTTGNICDLFVWIRYNLFLNVV